MVDLLEHEGKKIFKSYGINVPSGYIIHSFKEAKKPEKESVVKAQVPTGHRGINGGVVKVKDKEEISKAIGKISSIDFNGFKAESFLVEEMVPHSKEIYVGLTLDRSKKMPILIISPSGGVDIEHVPANQIKKFYLDILLGMQGYVKREAFNFIGLSENYREVFYNLMESLWKVFTGEDCELVEVNPLAVTSSGLVALDSKVTIEDDALFRHKNYQKEYTSSDPLEAEAKRKGIAFVRLGGDIGLIANGAGLTLATIDQIKLAGGNAGDFLDLGGTDDPEKVAEAINLVKKAKPKALFINIFGGVTKADTVAEGIVKAIKGSDTNIRIVVRLMGVNSQRGIQLLKSNGIEAFTDISEAVKKAVEVSN